MKAPSKTRRGWVAESKKKITRDEPKQWKWNVKKHRQETGVWIFIGWFLCFTYKNPVYKVVIQLLVYSVLLVKLKMKIHCEYPQHTESKGGEMRWTKKKHTQQNVMFSRYLHQKCALTHSTLMLNWEYQIDTEWERAMNNFSYDFWLMPIWI